MSGKKNAPIDTSDLTTAATWRQRYRQLYEQWQNVSSSGHMGSSSSNQRGLFGQTLGQVPVTTGDEIEIILSKGSIF